MKLSKRGDGRWIIDARSTLGKRVYLPLSFTKKMAQKEFENFSGYYALHKEGGICAKCGGKVDQPSSEVKKMLLSDLLNEYLVWYKKHLENSKKTNNSYKEYKGFFHGSELNNWLKINKIKYVTDLKQGTANDLITDLQGSLFNAGKGYAKKTTNMRFKALNKALQYGSITKGYFEYPWNIKGMDTFTLPVVRKSEQKKYLKFTVDQLSYIFKDPLWGEFYQWLYYSGVRLNDLTLLKWTDIDYVQRTIRLRVHKSKKVETYPLHQHLANKAKIALDSGNVDPIFPTLYHEDKQKRKDLSAKTRVHLQDNLLPRIGINKKDENGNTYTLHGIRGTSGQQLHKNGADHKAVALHLQHSTEDAVEHYIEVDVEIGNELLDKLPVIE